MRECRNMGKGINFCLLACLLNCTNVFSYDKKKFLGKIAIEIFYKMLAVKYAKNIYFCLLYVFHMWQFKQTLNGHWAVDTDRLWSMAFFQTETYFSNIIYERFHWGFFINDVQIMGKEESIKSTIFVWIFCDIRVRGFKNSIFWRRHLWTTPCEKHFLFLIHSYILL